MTNQISNIAKDSFIKEDVWIHTMCRRCQSECALLVRRVNGVVVKIEGDPESACGSQGGVCAKGLAGLQLLYDPNRIKYPLRRGNPKKGLGEDPQWKQISWDEALDEIARKLQAAIDISPERVMLEFGIIQGMQQPTLFLGPMMAGLADQKGAPLPINAAGGTCGNAGHFINGLDYAAFVICPDYDYCNYLMVFGTNHGFGGFQQYANKGVARARRRGMKVVVFDPACNGAAAKADEWVPIKPGTDAAVANAMSNVMINELGMYDRPYLQKKTNAPYLVGSDMRYIRDESTGKPMVWDSVSNSAKVFDDPSVGEYAIDGRYSVQGKECRPSFELLREHLKTYSPEFAEKISGAPAETLRRIAKEYAEAACIGSTIEIEGVSLPYRPAATINIRSASTHANGMHALMAIEMLHQVIGCSNAVGGCTNITTEQHGYPHAKDAHLPSYLAGPCKDGFVEAKGFWPFPDHVWPLQEVMKPRQRLDEMFPCALEVPFLRMHDRDEVLKDAGVYPEIDVLVNYSTNAMMNASNPHERSSFYERIPFVVDIDIFSNEFNEAFADILLPDTCYFEKADWEGMRWYVHGIAPGMNQPWSMHITQPVVEEKYGRRYTPEFINDLFFRMGRGDRMVDYYNEMLDLQPDEALPYGQPIDWDDLCNRAVTHYFGKEHDWNWFKAHGGIHWKKSIDEVYWRQYRDCRVQVYWEWMIDYKSKTEAVAKNINFMDRLRWEAYDPMPVWYPIRPHEIDDPDYDLFAFSWEPPEHSNANTQEQPWIDEVAHTHPFDFFININEETGRRKGLKPGDKVRVTSAVGGRSVEGYVQLRKGIHPDCLNMIAVAGHWAKGMPIARGKGTNFNSLITVFFKDCDPISMNTEPCLKVKIEKAS